MLSFKNIAAIATLAFGAVSVLAAPASLINVEPEIEANVLSRADIGVTSVPKILDNVIVAVTPIVADLKFITSENATVEAITPIVEQVKTIVNGAVDDVNKLVGQPVEVILATVEGTAQISVEDLAKLIADLFKLVFTAVDSVLGVAGGALGDLLPVLGGLGAVLGALLSAILALVGGLLGGLLSAVLGLLNPVLGVINQLGVGSLLSILQL